MTLPPKKLSTHWPLLLMLRRLCNRVWHLALMAAGEVGVGQEGLCGDVYWQ